MQIIMRNAETDFEAMKIADAMLSCGADVFSVTFDGQRTHHGAMAPHSRFIVWAKVENREHITRIDEAIDKNL